MHTLDESETGCLASALNLDDHGAPSSLFDDFDPRTLSGAGDYAEGEVIEDERAPEAPRPSASSASSASSTSSAPTKRTRNLPTLRGALLEAARAREIALGNLPPSLRSKGATHAVVVYADGKTVVLR